MRAEWYLVIYVALFAGWLSVRDVSHAAIPAATHYPDDAWVPVSK